jgi:hypothetical protein
MTRSIDTLANDRREAASSLARLLPELLYDYIGEFNRDAFHTGHEHHGNSHLTDRQYRSYQLSAVSYQPSAVS